MNENPYNSSSDNLSSVIKELDDLINLAEGSAKNVDHLQGTKEKYRFRSMLSLATGYGLLALSFLIYTNPSYVFKGDIPVFLEITPVIIGLFIFMGLFYWSFIMITKSRKIIGNLRVEHDIHERLLSMIDDQFKRAKLYGVLSPVSEATMEIRIRRLNRISR